MEEGREFKLSDVSEHKTIMDCWLVIDGRVLDVTKFLKEHPGGEEILIESAGKDATKDFEAIGHSKHAKNMLLKYQVGFLQGSKIKSQADDSIDAGYNELHTKEMEAFVIKEDPKPKYAAFFEFFVPLFAALVYLALVYIYM